MRGCTSGFGHLVNADIGSMGIIDHKGGAPTELPPHIAVIEDTISKLKQHNVSYEEAKRQLDFLEKGGDPLDFRANSASSLSAQSTLLMDHRHDHLGTSIVKDRLAVAASPPKDSIESNSKTQAPLDDNTGRNDFLKGERNCKHSPRRIIGQFEKSFRLGGIENSKESIDSAASGLRRKAYRQRNRSRSSRDGTQSSLSDMVSSHGVHTHLPSQYAARDAHGLVINEDNQKDYDVCLKSILNSTSPNYNSAPKKKKLNRFEAAGGVQSLHSNVDMVRGGVPDANASNSLPDNQHNEYSDSALRVTHVNKAQFEDSQEVHKKADLAGHKCASFLGKPKVEGQVNLAQMKGIIRIKGEKMSTLNEHQIGNAVCGARGLNLESSCNQTSLVLERNLDSKFCTSIRIGCSKGNDDQETVAIEDTPYKGGNKLKETDVAKFKEARDITSDNNNCFREQKNGYILKNKQALNENLSGSLIELDRVPTVGVVPDSFTSQGNKRLSNSLSDPGFISKYGNAYTSELRSIMESSIQETSDTKLSSRVCAVLPEHQNCHQVTSKLATMECKDLILEDERMTERITDISAHTLSLEFCRRSQWDFVLEEMAWLANDFAQERIWKISAASLIGHKASAAFPLKSHEQKSCKRQKEVAHYLAEAVVNFWRAIEERNKDQNLHKPGKDFSHAIQRYALRFLVYNTCTVQPAQADSPIILHRISDQNIQDMSWDTYLKEENLFYSVPTGAMEAYRKSVVSSLLQYEKTGSMKEEVETTCHDTLAVNAKRCADTLNVSIPTKRVRTASRQRVPSQFTETSGCVQAQSKTYASSGDTTSFLDDQSTLYGGLHTPNTYDSAEILHEPKKKEANIMRENNKRSLDTHELESNGSNAFCEGGLERGRKSKTLKIMQAPGGQPGLGSPWSLFEDQALMVLVHDMGPNWEFVSDAIGSISQCKCIFRQPKDCKERHKILMDSPAGDGADCSEYSGSSQPYRSTLPGIPKGIARKLFQHLQGPMEETTIKFHLEKVITLGKRQHCRTKPTQNLDHQRQTMISKLHTQVSQGSTIGVPPTGGSSAYPNLKTQTPSHLYPLHHLPHPMSTHQSRVLGNSDTPHLQKLNQTSNTDHQACVSRLAREKHIKQQPLLQQQYATSCALMPAVQRKSQLPLSSPQDISFQPQTSSPPVSLSQMNPFSKHSRGHQLPPQGAGINPQVGRGLTNQMGKQQECQPQQQQFQQAVRNHPQLHEQSRSQQQTKTIKGIGRGPKEHAVVNGLSIDSGSQFEEKGELAMQLVTTSQHTLPQQDMYPDQFYPHSNTDNSIQNHVVSTMDATVQTVASPFVPSFEQQKSLLQPQARPQLHAEPNSNIADQTHANIKNIPDWNRQVNASPPKKKQDVEAEPDLSSVNNYSPQMGTSTSVPVCVEAAYANSVVSAKVPQWKAPETESDSHVLHQAEFCSIVSSCLTSSGGEPRPLPFPGQGLVQSQSSVSFTPVTETVTAAAVNTIGSN
ncbi:chromatin modification-related protein EAF1 A isoform X2 [Daucus carota subsp. sativus]|uniref:chromatin modification-related protein EAF1 A isoform X2 n=1 Tax=Daucus carota subsp. sativus TaxID=79200 RepID=UPI0007F03A5A|nr:PREDICTED: chromatin modification-related protein EAF1 A-like isoform X1 [Daucus carota subsp. sativus]XP_017228934.1 PREDICTED: chromatin modification-related protein EAF1 A-like isoform X1 [Daucus carota subsp. sativus]XP_017228940.1 PREDICTED: chromatin modification-related protein EAF1 A-like isoform X1 [Daucus carota subsp. sativus]XP_017228945.1 PREDICTED: chromatin modification-related protein EAF1 A-like isoform X1 [Daucus carota subsp. sativus]